MAVNISSLVNTPGDSVDLSKFNYTSPQDCSQQGARSVKVLTVVVTASGSIIYAFGAYAAHTKLALLTGIFFRAHVCYQALYIPLTICGNGHYSKSPRDKDAGLEAACRASCMALHPSYQNGVCPEGGGYRSSCEVSDGCYQETSSASGWIPGAIEVVVMSYYGYILWSVWQRCKDSTADEVSEQRSAPAAAPALGVAPYIAPATLPCAVSCEHAPAGLSVFPATGPPCAPAGMASASLSIPLVVALAVPIPPAAAGTYANLPVAVAQPVAVFK
eukprot:CAMPEP_0113705638 /NCGR_PEP_ID=MMETSP0038_2-20120614/27251_1 /TAXON_ID=2898 /ORGANISM="Cryptomonas paramecium" /LENGTH=273 /DNA_ID=CAMNT_0000630683 /DNA_START=382 /DNA_END=1203 /DNA_ORIENTATION=- /assembly_acc=CAM_ASM_000170